VVVPLMYAKEDPFHIYTSVLVRHTSNAHITCCIHHS
jgi:hypothetical protein